MYKRFKLLIIFIFGYTGLVLAQVPLNLTDALELMRANNSQLKIQDQEIELSNSELSATNSAFLPRLSLSHTGLFTNDPLNAFGFKLQQKIVGQADFNPDLLNNPKSISNFNSKVSLQQPILNLDVFAAREALKEKIKANQYQKQFAEDLMEQEIRKSYANLQFLYEAKKAVTSGLTAYQEVLRNTRNLELQGYAKNSDVLMVQVGLTEIQNKNIDINNNIRNLSDYLNWLMGKPAKETYIPNTALTQELLSADNLIFSDSRSDILAMKSGLAAQNQLIQMNKRNLLPRLNAFGEYNWNDKKIVGFGASSYLAGFSLSWNLFDGQETQHKIKLGKIAYSKAASEMQVYMEKQQLELEKAKRDLSSQHARIILAERAESQAAETLRILENRYSQGLEKTSDLLIAQAKQLEKQVSHLEAIKDFNLYVIQINFLTTHQ